MLNDTVPVLREIAAYLPSPPGRRAGDEVRQLRPKATLELQTLIYGVFERASFCASAASLVLGLGWATVPLPVAAGQTLEVCGAAALQTAVSRGGTIHFGSIGTLTCRRSRLIANRTVGGMLLMPWLPSSSDPSSTAWFLRGRWNE